MEMATECLRHFQQRPARELPDEDQIALAAAAEPGAALCTIVGIEGSFSRRLGAQLAVTTDGSTIGSLADGCLEQQLARDCRDTLVPVVNRYGRGSGAIDFRLPCGGGLDILIDPSPDRAACERVTATLAQRREALLVLPPNAHLQHRRYIPPLIVRAFGEEPELEFLSTIGAAAGVTVEAIGKAGMTMGRPSGLPPADPWTAVVMLFHDHEWEMALLEEELAGPAFYIGVQGGFEARSARLASLRDRGVDARDLARIRSPIGSPGGSRSPQALALAILAEVTGDYERLRSAA